MEFQESVELLYPRWCKLFTSNSCKLYTTNRGVATSRIEPDPNDALADPKWWEFESSQFKNLNGISSQYPHPWRCLEDGDLFGVKKKNMYEI